MHVYCVSHVTEKECSETWSGCHSFFYRWMSSSARAFFFVVLLRFRSAFEYINLYIKSVRNRHKFVFFCNIHIHVLRKSVAENNLSCVVVFNNNNDPFFSIGHESTFNVQHSRRMSQVRKDWLRQRKCCYRRWFCTKIGMSFQFNLVVIVSGLNLNAQKNMCLLLVYLWMALALALVGCTKVRFGGKSENV